MNEISPNVIRDLLPVYLAGEASEETRSLVEEFLAADPELRELAAAEGFTMPELAPVTDSDELEKQALNRTCRLLSRKNWLMGVSLILTAVPLGLYFYFDSASFSGAEPVAVSTSVAVAMAIALAGGLTGWVRFLQTCRRLKVAGFEPARSWGRRFQWFLTGFLVVLSVETLIVSWMGWSWNDVPGSAPMFGGLAFALIGQHLGQISTPDEIERPTSLFDRGRR